MKRRYYIEYEVDNGHSYVRDVALVRAKSEKKAIKRLKHFIHRKGGEFSVNEIFGVQEINGDVFTGKHGNDDSEVRCQL